MSKSGATAAFRGYRLQTLYILSRLIDVEDHDFLYRPEGKEDLDIYTSDGQLLESIQVKAYSANLTLSDLSSRPSDSFFDRTLRNRTDFPDSAIRIVNFGPVGPEMEQAWSSDGPERKRVQRKLTEDGYSQQEIADLLSIKLDKVDEAELKRKVFAFLETTLVGGDPSNAFDLLMYWVCLISERREQISYSDVIDKLTNVGRYLEARSAYYDEWFTSILPLPDRLNSPRVDTQRLAQEYFQGVDARYEHILANLDVVRSEKLTELRRKFESSNVVIVHGASGQGKSTLAFRYLHDYTPNVWRFFVRFWEDRKHVLRVANALSDHAMALGLPCTVYIDVSPSDRDWPELVRELSHLSELNILVTIREEDWRRTTGYQTRFSSEELEISFDRKEAENLYDQWKDRTSQFLAFDEAWAGFGGNGPLLEFVYFLTQNQTLKSRINSQVRNLQDKAISGELNENELHLLRLVAVASAYEAKLDLKRVAHHLNLSEPMRTVEMYEKEYLIRVDKRNSTVTGLHSVRSSIILDSLLDEILSSWESVANECLPLLVESDLEIFLMHAFSKRRREAKSLLKEIVDFHPKSWIGVAGVLRALLWLGVRDYTETNRTLIDQVYGEWDHGWFLHLDSDLTGTAGGAILNFWHSFSESNGKQRLLEYIESIRAKQAPKDEVFVYARVWLQKLEPVETASSVPLDFESFAQVLFWSSHLQIRQNLLPIYEKIDIERIVEELPIDTLADLIFAIHFALGDRFDAIFQEHRARVALRFKHEMNTFALEDDGTTLRAHFIPESVYAMAHNEHTVEDTDSSTFHEEAIQRVELLRKLLPDRQKYGSQGYGHRLGNLSPEYDETEKTIDSSNFFPPWAQRINSHFPLLGNYPHRPKTWKEHAQQIFELRREILARLDQLQVALNTYFRKKKRTHSISRLLSDSDWESFKRLTKARPLLPQSAVDEWGLTGEGITQTLNSDSNVASISGLDELSAALAKHKVYIDSLHGYLRDLSNFASQGMDVIGEIANESHLATEKEHLATYNLHTALDTLTLLQIEFRERLGRFLPPGDLSKLEGRERRLSRELWSVWYQFAFHPRRIEQNASKKFVKERDDALKRVRRQIRRKLKALRQEGFSAYEALTDLKYVGENIPCIIVDINDPALYWQAIEDTIVALQHELKTVGSKSLRYYAIQFWMKHFAMIPLIRGSALAQSAFVFPTFSLQSGSALEKWYWYIPKEISDEDWARLRLPLWDREQFEPVIRFTESLAKLSVSAAQSGDLSRFSENVEYDEDGVIEKYIQCQSQNLSNQLQKVFDESVEVLNHYDISEIDLEERPLLYAALDIFTQMHKQIRPTEDYHCGIGVTVSAIKDWSERLEQVRIQAEHFKLLWIADVLDKRATEG